MFSPTVPPWKLSNPSPVKDKSPTSNNIVGAIRESPANSSPRRGLVSPSADKRGPVLPNEVRLRGYPPTQFKNRTPLPSR